MHKTKVAIVGMGTVGSGVARLLLDHGDRTARHAGRTLWLQKAVVRDLRKPRQCELPPGILTDRLEDVLEDEDIEVVALLMGGLAAAAAFGGHRWRLGALERKQAVQQAFARQLIDSQEADRKRIAADLHDGVSQTLVVIRNWARMGAPLATQDEPAAKRMGDIAEAASQALGEVRGVVQDLLPYQLERVGLVESMRETAARVADASGIAITCDLAAVDGRLSPGTQLRLFRVAQEGLNNVVKHSGARAASLEMIGRPAHVQLIIRDNGKGFVPGAVTPTAAGDGFGLVGMAERCRMMGGDLRVDSAPGKGTVITIAVPCISPTEGA